jgi:hypothetical protein
VTPRKPTRTGPDAFVDVARLVAAVDKFRTSEPKAMFDAVLAMYAAADSCRDWLRGIRTEDGGIES